MRLVGIFKEISVMLLCVHVGRTHINRTATREKVRGCGMISVSRLYVRKPKC